MTTYLQGELIDYDKAISQWIDSDSKQLVYSFPCSKVIGFLRQIEEVQESLGMEYSRDVILSCKTMDANPNDEKMVKWDEKAIEHNGYWFIVGVKIELSF